LWVLLIYIALDVASPYIPGAFVFEMAQSVEITVRSDPPVVETVSLPVMPRGWFGVPAPQNDVSNHLKPPSSGPHRPQSVVSCLPRAHCAAVRPSEDPH